MLEAELALCDFSNQKMTHFTYMAFCRRVAEFIREAYQDLLISSGNKYFSKPRVINVP